MFKIIKTSKKLKYINSSQVVKKVHLINLRDKQLIVYRKPTLETKAWIKKIANVIKKKTKKNKI